MKNEFQKVRGTRDYNCQIDKTFFFLRNVLQRYAYFAGLQEINTPIFEHAELFLRSVGESSDIVTKEFYDFLDKGGRRLVLRPEMTASVCRSVVENKLLITQNQTLKYFYLAPMFRYERPQSGRLRQFHQFGVECIGTNSPIDDADMIVMSVDLLDQVFNYHDYELKINNICGFETRKKWIVALKKYFASYTNDLSPDSLKRLDTNPLRILDDKIDGKKKFVIDAPKITEFATDEEKKYFSEICHYLDALKIKYIVDDTLVRGLDYYCNFVFEIQSKSPLLTGQPTLIGGGRYNRLIEDLSGPSGTQCVGFALGLERLMVLLENDQEFQKQAQNAFSTDVVISCLETSNDASFLSLLILRILRRSGISCYCDFNIHKLERNFKISEKYGAKYVIIFGKKEIEDGNKVIIKNQETMQQETVAIDDVVSYIFKGLKEKDEKRNH